MIVCTHMLTLGRRSESRKGAIMRERMRLSRQDFTRGLAGDFRPRARGGPRRLLPLV